MSRHLVGMVIASPGVHTDLEVNLKPNLDTEQGLSPIVTREVDPGVPRHLTGKKPPLSMSFSSEEQKYDHCFQISDKGIRSIIPYDQNHR